MTEYEQTHTTAAPQHPRLSILSPFAPFPPYAGGARHVYNVARHLSRYYASELLALSSAPRHVQWGALGANGLKLHAFQRDTPGGAWIDPPAVRMERSPQLISFVRDTWRDHPPDIAQFEYTSMLRYLPFAKRAGAFTVCTAHVVGFAAQVRRMRTSTRPALQLRRLGGLLSFWQYELRTLQQCDLVVTLAASDEHALHRWLPRLPVVTVPSGVELAEWPQPTRHEASDIVLFVGNYAHPPNVEGALWLAQEVWPLVLNHIPTARLVLAGRGPTPGIQALASSTIDVPGTVEDLQPLYAQATIGVAPIFWGGGIRIKLLEMMAAGLPIVATPLAADGIDMADCALFATSPSTFATAIVGLLRDRTRRDTMGAAARATVERRYDWNRLAAKLAGVYEGMRAGRKRETLQ